MRPDRNPLTSNVIDGKLYYFTSWLPDKLAPKRVFFIPCVFRKVPEDLPEGFRKPTGSKKHTCSFPCSSERFRKLTGSLTGSLFGGCQISCSSGRFRKLTGRLTGSLFWGVSKSCSSGSFRKLHGRISGSVSAITILRGNASWLAS